MWFFFPLLLSFATPFFSFACFLKKNERENTFWHYILNFTASKWILSFFPSHRKLFDGIKEEKFTRAILFISSSFIEPAHLVIIILRYSETLHCALYASQNGTAFKYFLNNWTAFKIVGNLLLFRQICHLIFFFLGKNTHEVFHFIYFWIVHTICVFIYNLSCETRVIYSHDWINRYNID